MLTHFRPPYKPFLGQDKGVFVLVKTSNQSSSELQTVSVQGGQEALFELVARKATQEWSKDFPNEIGLVVGATDVDALKRVRKVAPEAWILSPGVSRCIFCWEYSFFISIEVLC
jgi:uridine monophosphate synthetase